MSKVYVVQKPVRVVRDQHHEVVDTVALFDLSPAMHYGNLVMLFDPGAVSMMPERVIHVLHEKLVDFNDDDYILPCGDTVLVAAVSMIAAEINDGRYKILKWDKRGGGKYTSLQYNLKESKRHGKS